MVGVGGGLVENSSCVLLLGGCLYDYRCVAVECLLGVAFFPVALHITTLSLFDWPFVCTGSGVLC